VRPRYITPFSSRCRPALARVRRFLFAQFAISETVSDIVTADEYENLAPEEEEHFAMCVKMWRDV
jgi:hypothetical protein